MMFELLDNKRDLRALISIEASSVDEAVKIAQEHGLISTDEAIVKIGCDCVDCGDYSIVPNIGNMNPSILRGEP